MCRSVTCRTCSKTTWSGCGQHVDQVMRGVPSGQRCTCVDAERSTGKGLLGRILNR